MAQGPTGHTRARARHGLAVLALGTILTGPAGAAPSKQSDSQVSRVQTDLRFLQNLQAGGELIGSGRSLEHEVEPNDTAATAQHLASTPIRVRGDLYRALGAGVDEDVYSFTAAAGDRVYAATMTAFSGGSGDTELDILASDGTTLLETDDEDGSFNASSSNVAGTMIATAGTYYVKVRQFTTLLLEGTIRPYDLYLRVQAGAPAAEAEPNGGTPNPLPARGWASGAVSPLGDQDFFSVSANAGDTIIAILDVDPERDAPEWNARLGIGGFNGFTLVVNGSSVGGWFDDANPSEAFTMTVRTSGTYVILVDENAVTPPATGAATNTYNLSVSVIPARTRTCSAYEGTTGTIGDVSTTDFTLAVADAGIIEALQLSLNATHTNTDHLDVSLISPGGNEVVLFDDPPNVAGAGAPQLDFILDDEGAIPIGGGIYAGMHFTPETYARLAYFKGMQAQGTWTLRVRDDAGSGEGAVNSWSLNVCKVAPLPTCVDPAGEVTLLRTDFETGDAGFTHSGTADEWERGLPSFAPITAAHSGTNAFKTDLDGTYELDADFDLVSPNIDLSAVTGRVTLNWWQKHQMESASFDTYWVEVREVGVPATFRRVFEWKGATQTRAVGNPSTTVQMSAGWGLMQVDLSDFAGVNTEVRFHLQADDFGNFAGVAIDDFSVTACGLSDLIFKDGFE